MTYQAPTPLLSDHDLDSFDCRSREQTQWLREHALQSHNSGATRVFVVTSDGGPRVVAFYGWTMASIDSDDAPARVTRGQGRYPQPVALLARLGVDRSHEGNGLGAALLRDVLERTLVMPDQIGCRGLLIHAESPAARDFYLHLVPEFEPSPTDGLHLVVLVKDIRKTLARD